MRLCLNCYMYLSKLQCVFVLIGKCICPKKQLEQVLGAEYSVERRGVEGQHWAAGSNKSLCFCPTCSTTFWTSAVGLVLEITRTCLGPWDWVHSVIRELLCGYQSNHNSLYFGSIQQEFRLTKNLVPHENMTLLY